MVAIESVAKAFLNMESMTPKKLQKLCFYAYSWHLMFKGESLFENRFQAWVHGPVDPGLYHQYKEYGWALIPQEKKIPKEISSNPEIAEILESVYDSYGHLDGDELEALTHSELPWSRARKGLKFYEASQNPILDDDMIEQHEKDLEDE